MLSNDVGEILGSEPKTPSTPVSSPFMKNPKREKKTPKFTVKKPKGLSREAFNLVSGSRDEEDLISSVMPVDLGYKKTRAMVSTRTRRYVWTGFKNEARSDGLTLFHWAREDKANTGEPYHFSKFNKVLNSPTYNDKEYSRYLKLPDWTKEETDKLFEFAKRFDLRWLIVHDRYIQEGFAKTRSIEDLKERYYSIVNELQRLHNPDAMELAFDVDNERERKHQLEGQWNRTREELEEEAELRVQMEIFEARKKEREQRARELNQFYMDLYKENQENSESPGDQPAFKAPKPLKKAQRLRAGSDCIPAPTPTSEDGVHKLFRVPDYKIPGAHLRTHEILQLKSRAANQRDRTMRYMLALCRMDIRYTMGTTKNVELYNDFKKNILVLQYLKDQLATKERELLTLKSEAAAQGKVIEIPPRVVVSTIPESGLAYSQVTGEKDAPATIRRLTASVDKSDMVFDKNNVPIIPPECFR